MSDMKAKCAYRRL